MATFISCHRSDHLAWLVFPPMQLHYRPNEPVHPAVSPSDLRQQCVLQRYHRRALVGGFPGSFPWQKDSWKLSCAQLREPAPAKSSHHNATPDLCFLSLSCLFPRSQSRQDGYTSSQRWLKSVGLIRKTQEIFAGNLQTPTVMNQNLVTFCPIFSRRQLPTLLKGRMSAGKFGSQASQVENSQHQTLQAKPARPRPHHYSKVLHAQCWASLGFPSQVCFECWK